MKCDTCRATIIAHGDGYIHQTAGLNSDHVATPHSPNVQTLRRIADLYVPAAETTNITADYDKIISRKTAER